MDVSGVSMMDPGPCLMAVRSPSAGNVKPLGKVTEPHPTICHQATAHAGGLAACWTKGMTNDETVSLDSHYRRSLLSGCVRGCVRV